MFVSLLKSLWTSFADEARRRLRDRVRERRRQLRPRDRLGRDWERREEEEPPLFFARASVTAVVMFLRSSCFAAL